MTTTINKAAASAALTHAIASGNFGWTRSKESNLQAEVARIAAEKGQTGSDFRARQFRANAGRNIRRRALRIYQLAAR